MKRLSFTGVLALLLTISLSSGVYAKEILIPQKQIKEKRVR